MPIMHWNWHMLPISFYRFGLKVSTVLLIKYLRQFAACQGEGSQTNAFLLAHRFVYPHPLSLTHWPLRDMAVFQKYYYYTPASTKLKGGYTSITLSVCPSVRLSVCPSVDRIVSALYLQQYSSDPFHICTSYQATSEGVSNVMPVSKFKNLKFWRIF